MSPELIDPQRFGLKNSCPTTSSDCYALGMVIYETITGHVPFHEHTDMTVLVNVLKGGRPLREGPLTDNLWKTMKLCWAPHPKNRPSVGDVLQRLEMAQNASGVSKSRRLPFFLPKSRPRPSFPTMSLTKPQGSSILPDLVSIRAESEGGTRDSRTKVVLDALKRFRGISAAPPDNRSIPRQDPKPSTAPPLVSVDTPVAQYWANLDPGSTAENVEDNANLQKSSSLPTNHPSLSHPITAGDPAGESDAEPTYSTSDSPRSRSSSISSFIRHFSPDVVLDPKSEIQRYIDGIDSVRLFYIPCFSGLKRVAASGELYAPTSRTKKVVQ